MIFHDLESGYLAIAQPAHATMAARLTRLWGDGEVARPVEPLEEVCLAAYLHDLGWTRWETEPEVDPETRRPYSFHEMPLETHLEIFSTGPIRALTFNRYAALLVSMHGEALYLRRDMNEREPNERARIERFLREQNEFQDQLAEELRQDPFYADALEPQRLRRNQQTIKVCDMIALYISLGVHETETLPARVDDNEVALTLEPLTDTRGGGQLRLSPWLFQESSIELTCDARRLEGEFQSNEQLRQALATASRTTPRWTLTR